MQWCGNKIKKASPASGESKTPLSPLSHFNRAYKEGDHIKTCMLACVDSHCKSKKLSKGTILDLLSVQCTSTNQFTMHFTSPFHVPSIKWFLLVCLLLVC